MLAVRLLGGLAIGGLLSGCGAGPAEPSPPASPAPVVADAGEPSSGAQTPVAEPRSEHQQIVRALSIRDPQPQCDQVEALSDQPVEALLRVVDEVQMPPWVPMRAASCLLAGHGEAVEEQAVTWVSVPELKGLGILTLNSLDQLPEPSAIRVAEAALRGSSEIDARRRVQAARLESVRALASR